MMNLLGVNMEANIERLDKAFEWLVLFLTFSFATFFQWIITLWQPNNVEEPRYLAPIIFSIRFLFVPLIVIVLSWFGKIIAKNTSIKMFMRKFAWFWGMYQLWWYIFLTNILVTLDMSIDARSISMLIAFSMFPVIYFIYRKIMNLYKEGLSESVFWKGKLWNYGATVVAILTIICFMVFIFVTLPPIPQTP